MSSFHIEEVYEDEDGAQYYVNIKGHRERGKGMYEAHSDLEYYGWIDVQSVTGDYPDHMMDKIERWVDRNIQDWLSDYE